MKMDFNDFPQKIDYPEDLNVLQNTDSKYYYRAIEASASAYFSSSSLVKKLFYRRLKMTISLLDNQKYASTLDAGTGIGILLPFLSKISQKVKAIDYSEIINYAQAMAEKKKLDNISFEKLDLINLKTNEKYDLIVCLSVLEHIEDDNAVFKKFAQVLNPHGTLIVGYPIEYKVTKLVRIFESFFRKDLSNKTIKNSYKKTEEFTGHISNWKKIDRALADNFNVKRKIDLSFCLLKYYAIRKAVKKE